VSERIRAFVAVELNASVRARLSAAIEQLRASRTRVSWTKPDNLHVTLRFLGDIECEAIDRIGHELDQTLADCSSFALLARGLGAFPNLRKPKTIWCGVEGGVAALEDVQTRIETVCHAAGLDADAKPFHPHITLGRVRDRAPLRDLVQVMHNLREFEGGEVEVSAVTLFSSTLNSGGSVYKALRKFELR
jgi:2'-5' RNA ligase